MQLGNTPLVIIVGPTGVGKSDLALRVAARCHGEIINADIGQCYTPLTIGTAKPDWRHEVVAHHLFDTINVPGNATVMSYRQQVCDLLPAIYARGSIPLVVGGSGFYVMSLLWSPQQGVDLPTGKYAQSTIDLWHKLAQLDPVRAAQITQTDRYRLERALNIFYGSGLLPSQCVPLFEPVHRPIHVVIVQRELSDLHARVNQRVQAMIERGFIDEVRALDAQWRTFLLAKKIIGYDDIVRYLACPEVEDDALDALIELIQCKTRQYAKRQMTFLRMLRKKCSAVGAAVTVHEEMVVGDNYDSAVERISQLCEKGK